MLKHALLSMKVCSSDKLRPGAKQLGCPSPKIPCWTLMKSGNSSRKTRPYDGKMQLHRFFIMDGFVANCKKVLLSSWLNVRLALGWHLNSVSSQPKSHCRFHQRERWERNAYSRIQFHEDVLHQRPPVGDPDFLMCSYYILRFGQESRICCWHLAKSALPNNRPSAVPAS